MSERKTVTVKLDESRHQYQIQIGDDLLRSGGEWARECLPAKTVKLALVSNARVFRLYGEKIKRSLESAGFEVLVWLMKDGEKYKSLRSLEALLRFLSEKKITRTDAVVALGGGVVGDLAGFAAAVFLRGIAFLQIPTTLLAMIDSSVGGKTGVNTEFGKNLVGAFHQPHGVLIDVETLQTLPRRELVAGFCEAVKHGAIAGRPLFDRTADLLSRYPVRDFRKYFAEPAFPADLTALLAGQVAFKAEIVMHDERESLGRTDQKSRKILNFGHTLAHALEKVTEYKYFKHGEAVGYGLLFAAELSNSLEIFGKDELNLLNDVVRRVGQLPETNKIDANEVYEAFAFDKKNIGSSLQFILLREIGKPIILSEKDIPKTRIQQALKKVLGS